MYNEGYSYTAGINFSGEYLHRLKETGLPLYQTTLHHTQEHNNFNTTTRTVNLIL